MIGMNRSIYVLSAQILAYIPAFSVPFAYNPAGNAVLRGVAAGVVIKSSFVNALNCKFIDA